jgi:hypothetical protein
LTEADVSTSDIVADYVIVGGGAVGLAFADTLLESSDATMVLVDRRDAPGGHWNDAYPFVRLHAPSATYGVASMPLGEGRVDTGGPDPGLPERAGAAALCAYFDALLRYRLLPSGRVRWLPMTDWHPDGTAVSRLTGARLRLRARRRVVDATFADTRVPATHGPGFRVASGVRCIDPGSLVRLREPPEGWTIVGAGKTAMDAAVWLLGHGVDPDAITWIRPRDAWLLDRARLQPSGALRGAAVEALAVQAEAAATSASTRDLFARLESAGFMRRIDEDVEPTMFRCATVGAEELAMLRRIRHVVRLGRVTAIEPRRIVLERGEIPTSPGRVHVHCTADGIHHRPPEPVFRPGRIVLQYVRRCAPSFSAALVARLEATLPDDASRNAMCTPVPVPDEPLDWLRMQLLEARNQRAWNASPALRDWLAGCRLDVATALFGDAAGERDPRTAAAYARYRRAAGGALSRMSALVEAAEPGLAA